MYCCLAHFPPQVYRRLNWTESFHAWSPMGTYITTLHRMGAQIWGGPNWERINRYLGRERE